MQFDEIVTGRRSVSKFDADHEITDDELKRLFDAVILTPSSFNLQHWRFVVVRDPAGKAALRKASFNQEQVETASAVIAVVGKLSAHEDAEAIYGDSPEPVRAKMVPMIKGFYGGSATMQRDEAIRSASLAAMTLMFAAHDMGHGTCAMIGFDPGKVCELIGLDENHIPVMLVVLGRANGDTRARPTRMPPSAVVRLEHMTGEALT